MKRLENIFIMFACLLFACVRGNARKIKRGKRYLIVQPTRNIGDMVCLTPIMASIKKSDSKAFVTVMGSQRNKELLRHNKDVDCYIDYPVSLVSLVGIIRRERFDAGVMVDFSTRQFGAMFLGGIGNISCFKMAPRFVQRVPKSYRIVSRMGHQTEYVPGTYIPDQYLKLLEPFGIRDMGSRKVLGYSHEAYEKTRERLRHVGVTGDEKVIAIAPGAGADYKRWSPERFGELANLLYEKYGYPILIIGGERDREVVTDMTKVLEKRTRSWIPGPQAFDDLKAILALAELIVGNDSGAVHIGEALGKRTLVIAGVTDASEHFREDAAHKVVRGSIRGLTYQSYVVDESTVDKNLARRQMDSISCSQVFETAKKLLEQSSR